LNTILLIAGYLELILAGLFCFSGNVLAVTSRRGVGATMERYVAL